MAGEPPKLAVAAEPGAVKVTETPGTGLPRESFTVATRGVENGVLIVELCGVPPVAAMENGFPGVFVSGKVAGTVASGAVAVMLNIPATVPAVNNAEVAWPLIPVVAVVEA